jgi:glycosyltransferase involved in cell wall biosynthesis
MISVLILTLNEEANLPACLESVKWSDDIVVFDSFSTDRTVEIARTAGARVIQRAFDNERDHRAASLRLPFKYPWVYNPPGWYGCFNRRIFLSNVWSISAISSMDAKAGCKIILNITPSTRELTRGSKNTTAIPPKRRWKAGGPCLCLHSS